MLKTVLKIFMAHLLLLNPVRFDLVRVGMFVVGIFGTEADTSGCVQFCARSGWHFHPAPALALAVCVDLPGQAGDMPAQFGRQAGVAVGEDFKAAGFVAALPIIDKFVGASPKPARKVRC
jgi:hypothetical protein